MKNADMSAMPISEEVLRKLEGGYLDGTALGLTKREHFAGLAMQGLCTDASMGYEDIVIQSVTLADALLAELEKAK